MNDTIEDVLNKIIKMDLEFQPGSQFSYSDLGIILLMEIVEIVSNRSLNKNAEAIDNNSLLS